MTTPKRSPVRAALAALALLCAAPAAADVPDRAIEDALAAGDELGGLMNELEPQGRLPQFSDPRGGPLLKRMFDAEALLAGRPQGAAGAANLSLWSDVSRSVLARYFAFLSKPPEPAERDRMAELYQDEVTAGLVFTLRAMGNLAQGAKATLDTLSPAEAELPARRQGLEAIRADLAQAVQGGLAVAGAQELRPENARLLTAVIADEIALFAPLLTHESALAIRQVADAAAAKAGDEETAANLKRIVWSPVPDAPSAADAPPPGAGADLKPPPRTYANRGEWANAMTAAIRARVEYPKAMRDAHETSGRPLPSGRLVVVLLMDRAGAFVSGDVGKTSGNAQLDEAGLAAVRDSAPYPLPPADVPGDTVKVSVPLSFRGDDPARKKAPPRRAKPSPVEAPKPQE